eukprot:TRINITY_DN4904_c3_g1_i4.p1 TRINITY_DN4904_c3_g1~~TRINITY_DN4904_c3_g1_i4.p1  ORF type:complete len:360 (+),score=67.10 TRINITY_DN4904_c3_g1_i4:189-1268(+)
MGRAMPPAMELHGAVDPHQRPPCAGAPLQEMGPPEARRCLAGKRILYLGDSVMRYAMTQLAVAVDTGVPYGVDGTQAHIDNRSNAWYPPRRCTKKKCPKRPVYTNLNQSILWEHGGHHGWAWYFIHLVQGFGGRLCCDCYRLTGQHEWPHMPPREGIHAVARDNLHYSGQGTEIDFMFVRGMYGWKSDDNLRWQPGCPGHIGLNTTPDSYLKRGGEVEWEWYKAGRSGLDWIELGRRLFQSGKKFAAVVLSPGLWESSWRYDRAQLRALDRALQPSLAPGGRRILLLRESASGWLDGIAAHVLEDRGWQVVDVVPLLVRAKSYETSLQMHHFFLDPLHLQPWMSNEINRAILSEVCAAG